jgi:hypothetical protein
METLESLLLVFASPGAQSKVTETNLEQHRERKPWGIRDQSDRFRQRRRSCWKNSHPAINPATIHEAPNAAATAITIISMTNPPQAKTDNNGQLALQIGEQASPFVPGGPVANSSSGWGLSISATMIAP